VVSTLPRTNLGDDPRRSLPTTRITDEHEAALDAVTELPCFFQQHVPKRHELRVTVIGDRVFAARIDSQEDPRTATDHRDVSAAIRDAVEHLPPEIIIALALLSGGAAAQRTTRADWR
jgi:hypothetical protein